MIKRYGYERYMAGAEVIHTDHTGTLRRRQNGHGDVIQVVEVVNGTAEPDGSLKRYTLSVPPECRTAIEATAWTYGMTTKEYSRIRVRT